MIPDEEVKTLLSELADTTVEPVQAELADNVKHQIPDRLAHHRIGMDTIRIMIDLRINKLTAAAVIIVSMILLATFFGAADAEVYRGIKYYLVGDSATASQMLSDMSNLYEGLVEQGKDVTFYGDSVYLGDKTAVLMYWKAADGRYTVVFGDLTSRVISADVLIGLQAQMLRERLK